jgi:hypothetical protein
MLARTFKQKWTDAFRKRHNSFVDEFEYAFQTGIEYALLNPKSTERVVRFTISNACHETLGNDFIIEYVSDLGYELVEIIPQEDVDHRVSAVIVAIEAPFTKHAAATPIETKTDSSGMDRNDGPRDDERAEPNDPGETNERTNDSGGADREMEQVA